MTKYAKFGFSYIGAINSSFKVVKTSKVLEIDTYAMYLAPHNLSGHNVCAMATSECITGCLNTSGRAKMNKSYEMIMNARIKKTKLFYENRQLFIDILFNEINNAVKLSEKKGRQLAIRLNGTSDLNPILFKKDGKNVLETFPNIQFYDYTKILNRIELVAKYPNYDLTFSFNGNNWSDALIAIQNNVRVAVIFDTKKSQKLPTMFNGVPVIDGDIYDYRPIDEKNVIVGLRWKTIRNKIVNEQIKKSNFVVKVDAI
jgi:hypothetical protein